MRYYIQTITSFTAFPFTIGIVDRENCSRTVSDTIITLRRDPCIVPTIPRINRRAVQRVQLWLYALHLNVEISIHNNFIRRARATTDNNKLLRARFTCHTHKGGFVTLDMWASMDVNTPGAYRTEALKRECDRWKCNLLHSNSLAPLEVRAVHYPQHMYYVYVYNCY